MEAHDLKWARRVAPAVAELLRDDSWVHRNVESIEFLDESRVRRQVSIDFTLPSVERAVNDGRQRLVPLSVLTKGPIKALDVVDADGTSVPVLTSKENGLLAGEVLVEQARRRLDATPRASVRTALREIATAFNPSPTRFEEILAWLDDLDRSEFDKLTGIPEVWVLRLWENFLFIGMVEVRPGERTIVKRSYEEEISMPGGLGVFEAQAFFRADSYHMEVVAPEDAVIADANLQVFARVPTAGGEESPRRFWVDRDRRVDRAHLYGRRGWAFAELGRPVETTAAALVWVRLRPWVIEPILVASMFVLGVFVAGVLTVRAGWAEDVPSATAVVVALPALATVYAASARHRLARRLLRGVRLAAVWSALASFGAAVTLVVKPPDERWSLPAIDVAAVVLGAGAAILLSTMIRELISARFVVLNGPGDGKPPKRWRARLAEPRWWLWPAGALGLLAVAAYLLGAGPRTPTISRSPTDWLWLGSGAVSSLATAYLGLAWLRALWNSRKPADNGTTMQR
jgi:hypothetical protein